MNAPRRGGDSDRPADPARALAAGRRRAGVRRGRADRLREPGADLPDRVDRGAGAAGAGPGRGQRRDGRRRRRVRVGQVDAAVHPGRHRRADRRPGPGRPVGPAGDVARRPGALPAAHRRVRPAADGEQPGPVPDRPADGRPADDGGPHAGTRPPRPQPAELLGALGVADCADRRPAQLSGGQQMRVAIAVALANEPRVLLADEPTGELDTATSAEVFGALRDVNRELGVTVVVVTHDPGGQRPGGADGGDPGRADQQRGAAPHRHRRRRRHARDRRGVRGDGPGRPGPGAPRLPRGAGPDPAGPAGAGARPRHDPARRGERR